MRGALALAALLAPAVAAASPFGVAAVADNELAAMRGGVRLPNGLDVSVGITLETRIDGQLALRSVAGTDGSVQVFSGGPAAMTAKAAPGRSTPAAPTITINRSGAGTVIAPALATPNVSVGVTRGPAAPATGGTPIALEANGAAVATGFGSLRLEKTAQGSAVVLSDPTLLVRQLIGTATGVVVANTADNRAIDTTASINVDLRNATALVGSNLLAIDTIAADAAARSPFR